MENAKLAPAVEEDLAASATETTTSEYASMASGLVGACGFVGSVATFAAFNAVVTTPAIFSKLNSLVYSVLMLA